MRFHAILLTRDDGDIVDECIRHALTWCDALYVYDTGSTDTTWDRVLDWRRRDARVEPLKRCAPAVVMTSSLRGHVFNLVRHRFESGDWVVQQDVDEFYHVSPQDVVQHLHPFESCIYYSYMEFRITKAEVQRWYAGDDSVFDRARPVQELRRYYVEFDYYEPRLFRYRQRMQWSPKYSYPWNMGYVAKARIPIRHYPHRDPLSLQLRLTLRNHLLPLVPEKGWVNWRVRDWQEFVIDDIDPNLRYWPPGQPLQPAVAPNHLKPGLKRLAQYLAHRWLLPVLDSCRPSYPRGFAPPEVPPKINQPAVEALRTLRNGGLTAFRTRSHK